MTPFVDYLSSKHKGSNLTSFAHRTDAKARHDGMCGIPELGVWKKVDSRTLTAHLAYFASFRPMRELVS